ncbi:CLIP domain-containing serine protease B9-like isoform X2 [Culex pipiens pallens]|uniref:CLIP domain-containing serine protease B9-like isoform X2 n=1 Tax=Culex pipiens pallens TaxID=42434 RepID=UPI001954B688|nr:CLIP domain-containing serine protease B9-like isoform X2 [Culex pipiens pallens]
MAVLRYKGEDTNFEDKCVGSIIHRRYILTAAQCLWHKTGIKVDHVILGEHNKNTDIDCNVFKGPGGEEIERECADPVQRYEVESSVYHPNFNISQYTNDIGLIRLATEVSWEYNIQPICLPVTPQLRVRLFKEFIVTGWGSNERYQQHQVLQEAVLPLASNADCQQRSSIELTERQLCAGGGLRVQTGGGDGGGPWVTPPTTTEPCVLCNLVLLRLGWKPATKNTGTQFLPAWPVSWTG